MNVIGRFLKILVLTRILSRADIIQHCTYRCGAHFMTYQIFSMPSRIFESQNGSVRADFIGRYV